MSTAKRPQRLPLQEPPQARKEAPRARHKAKPKFDIPVETAPTPESPVGWVYRAEEAPVAPAPAPPQPQYAREGQEFHNRGSEKSDTPDNAFLMVGKGVFLIGMGTIQIVSGIMLAPFRFAWALISE